MKTVSILFVALVASVQAFEGEKFMQTTADEPLEAVNNVKQVPVVGSQFATNGAVPTAMQCVVSLTIQFMLCYTALAICRMAADGFGLKYDNLPIQKILTTACHTVAFAPMLAILFLACRMRVNQLTKNKGNPPEWVQICMYFCTYAVLLMTLIVVVIPLFTGETIGVDPKTGDIPPDTSPFKNQILAIAFTVLKYFCLIGLYGGVLAVCYGIITYVPPPGIWPEGKDFPVAPAVQCTMILSCQYFIVYGGIQVARTFTQFSGMKFTKFENAMMTATNSMNFAPMLAVLFIAARMRALNMDPVNGNPQKWAQNCFYMCTYAVLAQTLLSIAVPLVLQGDVKVGKTEGDMEYQVENKMLGTILALGRYAIMICIYVGFSLVIWSILTIQHPKGPEYTIPISVTMQCVINLTVQFFFVYGMIWVCVTLKEFTGFEWALLTQTMENAKGTIMFCPMLAILFVGTRMRALQMTNNKGAPQGWAQDGMYLATWSIFVQFFMVVIAGVATGEKVKTDADGNATWHPTNIYLWYGVQVVRWFAVLALWGGAITVIFSVFIITPETANGRGAIPLVTDGTVPVVGDQLAGPPPGAQNLPGMEPGGAAGDVMAPTGSAGDVMKTAGDTATDPTGAVSF